MDKAAMVSMDLARGFELLEALDHAKVKVAVARWVLSSDYEDWRLYISARQFDRLDLREAYGLIHKALDPAGFNAANTPPIIILRMTDPFIKELRRYFGKTTSAEGTRLGPQMFGNRFVEDAYVYRVS